MFFWSLINGGLKTNIKRYDYGFSNNDVCAIYGNQQETNVHLFRDFFFATEVWNTIKVCNMDHIDVDFKN